MNQGLVYFTIWNSPVGELYLYADSDHLLAVTFPSNDAEIVKRLGFDQLSDEPSPIIEETICQLGEYFKAQRREFDLPLWVSGTPFQEKAWAALQTIPLGAVMSYREQAALIESPMAVRAVGSANSRNPISIIIPCHRVLGSDGKVSGYSGGSKVKAQLLALEGYTAGIKGEKTHDSSTINLGICKML